MDLLRRHRTAIVTIATASVVFMAALPAFAAIVPACALEAGKNPPDLNCVLQTFAGIATLILGITGSAALLMFVYGGFVLLSSGGESSKVTEGKTILRNAIIGILIIFTSGYIVQYGMQQLQSKAGGDTSKCTSANPGYSCRVPSADERASCVTGLCPGAAENICCPPAK
jgi:hypothetical protein